MIDNLFKRLSLALVGLSAFAFCFLTLPFSFAEDNDTIVDDVIITVPAACSIKDSTGGAGKTYNVSMMPGQYNPNIGSTTIVATCNDASGFALYAIGYGNEEYGNTDLITNLANPGASGTSTGNIVTGTAQSGPTSNWAMKLSTQTNPAPTYPIVIQNGFGNFSAVPSTYTLVAKRTSATDAGTGAEGARLNTHYAVYVSPTQVAATYTGKVKYDIVHPNDADPPEDPRFVTKLDTGQNVNQKLKTLAGASNPSYTTQDNTITALKRANALPSGFTPSTANTISTSDSALPIYAWYDSNDTTIYYYSESNRIYMNEQSNHSFYQMRALSDLSTIATWDTSKVTNMYQMFSGAGRNANTFDIGDLSSWNTASVTNMSNMFYEAGRNANTFDIGDLSSWNTASVTDMSGMFYYAGNSATTWSIGDLSGWNTASVTNMSYMFYGAGRSATTWSIGDLSSWNTASVTDMSNMFRYAGYNANAFNLDLSSWSTAKVTNMSYMFYEAGYSATTFNLDLSSWNTASVTNMSNMFSYAGYSATTFNLDFSSWNTASVTNMSNMFFDAGYSATTWSVRIPRTNGAASPISNTVFTFYGKTTSVTASRPSGKYFTLAD